MLGFKKHYPLAPLTTLKVGGEALEFVTVETEHDIESVFKAQGDSDNLPTFILGSGSNIVVSDNGFPGRVVHLINRGISIAKETPESAVLKVSSGEVWDDVVAYAASHNLWGIENLSHIPGSAGALAVQNVGAYGQEASNVVERVEVFDRKKKKACMLGKKACGFAYRQSIFNRSEKGRYIIVNTFLKLHKKENSVLSYPDVRKYFEERKIEHPALVQIRQAIIEIRNRKFPFPVSAEGGNVGSFFKNCIVSPKEYENIERMVREHFGEKVADRLREIKKDTFPVSTGVKIPAAFLIEICGLKGVCVGGMRVNRDQPLVLVNTGTASARDVMELFKLVRCSVFKKTGVVIVNEPEFIGFTDEELRYYLAIE